MSLQKKIDSDTLRRQNDFLRSAMEDLVNMNALALAEIGRQLREGKMDETKEVSILFTAWTEVTKHLGIEADIDFRTGKKFAESK